MLKKIYYWFHKLTSKPEERDEYSSGYWQDKVRKKTLLLCRGVKGRILEVGCGEGLFLTQLAKQDPVLEIWGVDNNPALLNKAETRIRESDFINTKLLIQEATNLSFEEAYFDTIICINVFFNLDSVDMVREVLNQMKRVCKKSGRIIFDIRNSTNFLLALKYKFARYYDETVKNLPLNTYNLRQIESILNGLNLKVVNKKFVGFPIKIFAPIIIIEAKKEC